MNVIVIIECEKGSNIKNVFNEQTLEDKESFAVSRTYPFPYGFIQNTKSGDGDCLDCFILSNKTLKAKSEIEAEVIGMFEQFETRGDIRKEDHNILVKFKDENLEINDEIRNLLKDFVLHVWDHRTGKKVEIGNFYGKKEAEILIEKLSL